MTRQRLLGGLAASLVRLLCGSLRVERRGVDHLEGLRRAGRPFLFAVWHGRMLLPIHQHRGERILALVSLSADGDLASAVLERLGYATVRGSSSRGGREAFHELAARLAPGQTAAIVPDGPRGPARQLKPGLLRLASVTGAAILPLSAAARPALRLGSWDRFALPLPFARAVLGYGEPLEVPAPLDGPREQQLSLELTQRLDQLGREVDHGLGLAAADPA